MRFFLIGTAVLLVLTLGSLAFFWPQIDRILHIQSYHSSPAAIRPYDRASYLLLTSAPTSTPTAPEPESVIQDPELDLEGAHEGEPAWIVRWSTIEEEEEAAPPELVQLKAPAWEVPLGDGMLSLDLIGRLEPQPKAQESLALDWSRPNGDAYAEASFRGKELPRLNPNDDGEVSHYFLLSTKGEPLVELNWLTAFDAASYARVTSSAGWGQDEESIQLFSSMAVLHQTPVHVFVNLWHGTSPPLEMPIKPDAMIEAEGVRLRLLGMAPAKYLSEWGGDEEEGISSAYFVWDPEELAEGTVLFLLLEPGRLTENASFEVLDQAGQAHRGYSSESGPVVVLRVNLSPEEMQTLQLHLPSRHTRVLMEIPPRAQAQEVENLFDVRIPFAECQSYRELSWIIEASSQMEMSSCEVPEHFHEDLPESLVFKNRTVAELLEEYRQNVVIPAGMEIEVDAENQRIHVQEPEPNPWWERLLDMLPQL